MVKIAQLRSDYYWLYDNECISGVLQQWFSSSPRLAAVVTSKLWTVDRNAWIVFSPNDTFFRNIMRTSSSCRGQPVRRVTCCVAAKAVKAVKAPLLWTKQLTRSPACGSQETYLDLDTEPTLPLVWGKMFSMPLSFIVVSTQKYIALF